MTVKINGVSYRWKQEVRTTGMAAIGSAPAHLRTWYLRSASMEDSIAGWVQHTHAVPSYVTPKEPPAWKPYVRVTLPNGTVHEGYLKHREPDPESLGNRGEALAKAKAWLEAYIKAKLAPPTPNVPQS